MPSQSSNCSFPDGLYQDILSRMDLGFVLLCLENPDDFMSLRVLQVNPAASQVAGFSFDDYVGKTAAELPRDKVDVERVSFYAALIQAGVVRDLGEIQGRQPATEAQTFSVRAIPLSGRFLALLFENVTRRSAAERELRGRDERLYKLFHASPIAISVSTLDGARFLDVNQRWADLTGYDREETINGRIRPVDLWADPEAREQMIERLRTQGSLREIPITYRTRQGMLRRVVATVERVELDGEDCLLTLIMRN